MYFQDWRNLTFRPDKEEQVRVMNEFQQQMDYVKANEEELKK